MCDALMLQARRAGEGRGTNRCKVIQMKVILIGACEKTDIVALGQRDFASTLMISVEQLEQK